MSRGEKVLSLMRMRTMTIDSFPANELELNKLITSIYIQYFKIDKQESEYVQPSDYQTKVYLTVKKFTEGIKHDNCV
jgi:hypothetical protein